MAGIMLSGPRILRGFTGAHRSFSAANQHTSKEAGLRGRAETVSTALGAMTEDEMADNASACPRLLATLGTAAGKGVVTVEDSFDADIDTVVGNHRSLTAGYLVRRGPWETCHPAASITSALRQRMGRYRSRGRARRPPAAESAAQGARPA